VLDVAGAPLALGRLLGPCVATGLSTQGLVRGVVGWHVIMFEREYAPGDVVYLSRRHRGPHATPRG